MTHAIFDENIQYIKGIGPRRAEELRNLGIDKVIDLLEYFPRKYLDRSQIKKISDAQIDEETTFLGEVVSVHVQPGFKKRLVVTIRDGSGYLQGIWFHGISFFEKFFTEGLFVSLSGKISYFGGWQIIHPDFDILGEEIDRDKFLNTGIIIPVYPSSEKLKKLGLTSIRFRQIFKSLFDQDILLPEILPETESKNLPLSYNESLREIHFPTSEKHLKNAIYTLKFTELFLIQIIVALRFKILQENRNGISFNLKSDKIRSLIAHLPFQLTGAQKNVLKEIAADLSSVIPMHRLLQGDVGSGKTIVAFIAMLLAHENGYQAVMMAPTEILAEQHANNSQALFAKLGIRPLLLKGGLSKKERKEIYDKIEDGSAGLIFGTHALIQKSVKFNNLGLVIIDEQHRFGVLQRKELLNKGKNPHVLVMTATPIPRTMTMTVYGDLNVSTIDEMPGGRKAIITVLRDEAALGKILLFIEDHIKKGRQTYVIYPLIEESEKLDLQAASDGFEFLKNKFKDFSLALIHGRLKADDKNRIMEDFHSGKIQILVSTTVVEVGVDVANASIMLIMNAERFGLSQLHQLRGRVGRGEQQSYCILLKGNSITPQADMRLKALVDSNNGFEIAEMDWQIRGAGEFFGIRQSGFDDLKIANLSNDDKILEQAKAQAFALIQRDPQLRDPENKNLRFVFLAKYKEKLGKINLH